MNDAELLHDIKVSVSARLSDVYLPAYDLGAVDSRLEEYVADVCAAPDWHNVYEQLAVERFLGMVDKYDINVREVHRFVLFYESLMFPSTGGYSRYKLTPVQYFQFCNMFAFWSGGKRVVREVLLFVPRKFSKTTSVASLSVYDLLYGDANSESYMGANSSDQAKKCFDVVRSCMRHLDPYERRYRINEQTVKSLRKDRSGFAQCLTSNARTKDGLNASTVIMDEFSQAKDSNLLTVLTTSMGVRKNPLTVIITTASDVFDGPFYDMLKGYKALLRGEYEDDSVFAHIFEPDVGDAEDSEQTWYKVHPHIGVTVDIDFYRQEYKKALRNGAEAMLAFRTKLLNVYAENESRTWISATLATEISRPMSLGSLRGRPDAMVAIDLSESDDFSAVSFGVYDVGHKSFAFHTSYFFPEGALKDHPNETLYRKWASEGYLRLCKGDVIDYGMIVEYVLMLNERVRILGIGYDPWKSTEVINMLGASGARNVLNGVRQSYGNFTAAVESFEHGAKLGRITINDNPINAYCFGNAVLDYDKLENMKPVKRNHNGKIDGVITMLMCMKQFMDYER